jgi:hypothetical protein
MTEMTETQNLQLTLSESIDQLKSGEMALYHAYRYFTALDDAERIRANLPSSWSSHIVKTMEAAMSAHGQALDQLKRVARGEFPLPFEG